jgi:hypothetical protein
MQIKMKERADRTYFNLGHRFTSRDADVGPTISKINLSNTAEASADLTFCLSDMVSN